MLKCKGPCGENKPKEAFVIRGKPVGEGICYECTKLIRKEKRKEYVRNYYREYRKAHPEETLKAQRKAQEKLKARRLEAKYQKAVKEYLAKNVIEEPKEVDESKARLARLEGIKNQLEQTREELKMEIDELRKKGDDSVLLLEIEAHALRTRSLIKSVEEQMKSEM